MDTKLVSQKHLDYLWSLEKSKDLDALGYYLTEHLRVGGAYWSLTALKCMKSDISIET